LPIPFGYAQGITGVPINTRNGQLWFYSRIVTFLGTWYLPFCWRCHRKFDRDFTFDL